MYWEQHKGHGGQKGPRHLGLPALTRRQLQLLTDFQVKVVQIGTGANGAYPGPPRTTTDDKANLLMFDLLGGNAEPGGLKQRAISPTSLA